MVEIGPSSKKDMLRNILSDISRKTIHYNNKWATCKKIDDVSETIVIALSTLCMSSIFVLLSSFDDQNDDFRIISAITSSSVAVMSSMKRAIDLRGKYEHFKTIWNQYSDLKRDISLMLIRNHLSNKQLEELIESVNIRLSLIEDNLI